MKRIFILILFFTGLFLVFKWNYPVSAGKNLIIIDPGHGGFDGGCSYEELKEKELNLCIALLLRDYLLQLNYEVLLTRDGDYLLGNSEHNKKREDAKERVKLIDENNALLFVSIHMNYFGDDKQYGAQVFHKNTQESKDLAEVIQEQLFSDLGTVRKSTIIRDIYLMDHTKTNGVLIECGFLSNPKERVLLQNPLYQKQIAFSITQGIINYLDN